jgi:dihydrofolate reductase
VWSKRALALSRLKADADQDLVVFGGARIAHGLMLHRLIGEYRLTVHPVALGDGLDRCRL